jgi:hypothetical protein
MNMLQDEDSGHLWCDSVLGKWLLMFQRIAVPSSSGSSSLRRVAFKMSGTAYPATHHHIPEDVNTQQYVKFCSVRRCSLLSKVMSKDSTLSHVMLQIW